MIGTGNFAAVPLVQLNSNSPLRQPLFMALFMGNGMGFHAKPCGKGFAWGLHGYYMELTLKKDFIVVIHNPRACMQTPVKKGLHWDCMGLCTTPRGCMQTH